MQKAYINATIFTGEDIIKGKTLLVKDDEIIGIVDDEFPTAFEIVNANKLNIAPAFIDLQIYGGSGQMFSLVPTVASLDGIYNECKASGTQWFQATVATNTLEVMLQSFEAAKAYKAQNKPGLLGIHLEGPYINAAKKGAHQEKFIRKPSVNEIEQLLKEGEGVFTMMTLAPECCDAKIISMLNEAGVIISAGHSAADYETAKQSFKNGITAATHLHNAMSAFKNREPGLAGAIFDSEIYCSVIPDGIHVDYATLRISKKIMQDKLFIITDAITAYSAEGYDYVKLPDRFVTKENILAGSCLSIMQAVKNCVQHAGIQLDEALRMATDYPAKVIGKENEIGFIKKGLTPKLVFFDDDLNVVHP